MFKFYEVGGCVRDEIMGGVSKDIDYVAVLEDFKFKDVAFVFDNLRMYLQDQGYTIWLSTPECFTIRAKFPACHKNAGVTADFVLARKEIGYVPGTRQPIIEVGTLLDDLTRRDFTVNAIAKDEAGTYIDPFGGLRDIEQRLLVTPLPVMTTFNDDPLRILRAIRFSITKGFMLSPEITTVIKNYDYDTKMFVVSEERIREELYKAMKYDSFATLTMLTNFGKLASYIFTKTKLWLKPTNEQ